ncbi:L-type lectin-domain containing receptor kinase SIT2 isoform X2 [Jatropha curcas]|uniref:L-type lectin-domain containing receptor kinase SIT2 isoform X2 n=1 Tax=Jatropha curcas TaxID=180498 RepID=UPI0018959607|nr:L-type lectin-domain containing receptor kinase SIT2 isoform X2 [Jatropha curcas]
MISAVKLQNILFCLSVTLKFLALAQPENQFIYHGFNGANLNLNGAAKVHSNGLLELTNISYQQIGRAFFPIPFNFSKSFSNSSQSSFSFSTNFAFAIVPERPDLGGHGIAFTISPSVQFTGALATQYFGLFNSTSNGLSSNHVFAVELDTLLTTEFGEKDDNHVGIDVNGLTSNASALVAYYSEEERQNKNLKLISGNEMQVWIDYDDVEKLINVTLAPIAIKKPEKPLLSRKLDLSLIFLDSMYIGFSSSTGAVASHHYILGWSFNKNGQAQNLDISKLPPLPSQRNSTKTRNLRIIIASVTAIILLMLITGAVYIVRRKKYEELREDWEKEYGPQRFSYEELYKATKGFKDKELLGFGGFGRVYRGVLPSSNTQVAVKKVSHGSQRGMKEFVAEIVSMGRLRHRNLVQLLGYCRRKGELLLVYDYMPNGSLDKFLFRRNTPTLNWVQRYQILKGVASALVYLHEEWEQVVIHRDVKASNVLLDADLNGRLGDFGLAKLYDRGSTPQTTCIVGTVGYLAPEVTRTGKATTSSDVFAFGTFMLEVACGRKPVEAERQGEEIILVDWVLDCYRRGVILETSDPKLQGNYIVEEMELVLKLGLLCVHPIPAARPIMRQVIQYLDGDAILPQAPMDGFAIGLITVSQEAARDCSLSFPESNDYSGLSSTDSILSYGR